MIRQTLKNVLVLAVAAGAVGSAGAQSNSLLNRGGNGGHAGASAAPHSAAGAPTSQPTAPTLIMTGQPPSRSRATAPANPALQPVNPILFSVSAIAVEMPQPERIGVHDLVTIIVREDKTALSDAKTKSDKEWTVDNELSKWFRINDDNDLVAVTFPDGTPGIDYKFNHDWEGKGQMNRKDSLVTRITASVIDVKPNGLLVLEAKKTITVDDEEQIITLTGQCRSADVSPQNTVLSTQLADTQITAKNSGIVRDATRRGWLKKIMDWVRPI